MKKLLCGVLALMLLMLGTCIPALAEKLVDSGDFGTIHWELDSKGKLTVTGTGKMENIPALEYYRIRNKIKKVEIGGDITEIGRWALDCGSITEIIIGEQVTRIDICSFMNCNSLKSIVYMGDKVTGDFNHIGYAVYYNNSKLTKVIIPETAHIILSDKMVLSEDGKILYYYIGEPPQKWDIPHGIEELGAGAVKGNLKEISIPSSLVSFYKPFTRCKQLKDVYFEDITQTINCWEIFSGCGFTSITLPPCELRDEYAPIVGSCEKVKTIALGEGTTTIGCQSFIDCPSLERLFIPETVVSIDPTQLYYPRKLTLMVREGSYAETFAKENGFKYAYFTPVSGIMLSEQALTLKKGKSVALTAEIAPADATEQTLIWCSSDPKVATVTKGKVKAVGVGSCEIICYASDGSNTRTVCTLTVEK